MNPVVVQRVGLAEVRYPEQAVHSHPVLEVFEAEGSGQIGAEDSSGPRAIQPARPVHVHGTESLRAGIRRPVNDARPGGNLKLSSTLIADEGLAAFAYKAVVRVDHLYVRSSLQKPDQPR